MEKQRRKRRKRRKPGGDVIGPRKGDFQKMTEKSKIDDLKQKAQLVLGTMLGYYTSLSHGLCPDTPSVSGNIHRVVEGVKIYE